MLRPSHNPNKAGKAIKIATLSGTSNLLVLYLPHPTPFAESGKKKF
jgi:hypothetical protein